MTSTGASVAEWSALPESLWLFIFSRCHSIDLLAIKEVCHQWRRIAEDVSLTSCLDLSSKSIDLIVLKDLLFLCQNNLFSFKCINFLLDLSFKEVMTILRDNCRQLKRLSLDQFNISYEDLPNSLTHLSLSSSRFNCFDFFEPNITNRLDKFRSIVYLNISHLLVFDSQMCRSLNRFQSLKYLYMEDLFRVNNGGVTDISSELMSRLVVLDLCGTDLKDESFEYILKNGNSLEELYLGRTQIAADFDLTKSVANRLKVLCLQCTPLGSHRVQSILQSHPSLNCFYCNENIIRDIDSPILMTKPNDSNISCFHYNIDKRFDIK